MLGQNIATMNQVNGECGIETSVVDNRSYSGIEMGTFMDLTIL